jgi:hypothetical protein
VAATSVPRLTNAKIQVSVMLSLRRCCYKLGRVISLRSLSSTGVREANGPVTLQQYHHLPSVVHALLGVEGPSPDDSLVSYDGSTAPTESGLLVAAKSCMAASTTVAGPANEHGIRRLLDGLSSQTSEDELQRVLASILVVCEHLQPSKGARLCTTIDSAISNLLSRLTSPPSVATSLLAAHVVLQIQSQHGGRTPAARERQRTPDTVILVTRQVIGTASIVEDRSYEGRNLDDNLERLSLCFQVLANYHIDHVSQHFKDKLARLCFMQLTSPSSSLSSPTGRVVPMPTLLLLLDSMSHQRIPNGFIVFQALFSQISRSLASPLYSSSFLQAKDFELLVQGMKRARLHSTSLIQECWTNMESRQIEPAWENSMALVEALMEFNIGVALQVIVNMPYSKDMTEITFPRGDSSFELRRRMGAELAANRRGYSYTDLIVALYCYGVGGEGGGLTAMLETVECEVVGQVKSLSLNNLVTLLHGYALAKRNHPDIIREIDNGLKTFIRNGANINLQQLPQILHSLARLNHRPAYLPFLSDLSLQHCRSIASDGKLSNWRIHAVSVSMWSLAVLEGLTSEVRCS